MTSKQALLVLWGNFKLFLFAKIRRASELLVPITIILFGRGILIRHETIWVWVNGNSMQRMRKLTITKVKRVKGMWYFYERPEQLNPNVGFNNAPLCDYDFNTALKYYKML